MPRNLPMNGFPEFTHVLHKYAQYVNLDATAGALAKQVFRANSLFDPDYTGTGHQPMGHDEMNAVYGHYLVLRSEIRVTGFSFGSTNYPLAWGIILDDDGSTSDSTSRIIEQGKGPYVISNNNYLADKSRTTLVNVFDAKSFFHVKDPNDVKYEIGAAGTANPADGAYFILWIGPIDETSDLNGAGFNVEITYEAIWSEKSTMPQS